MTFSNIQANVNVILIYLLYLLWYSIRPIRMRFVRIASVLQSTMSIIFHPLFKISYRRYNLNVMRQSACLFFNPIMVNNYAAFFNCTPVGYSFQLFILVGWDRSFLSVAWPDQVQLVFFFCSGVSKLFGPRTLHRRAAYSICESLCLIHQDVYHGLFVCSW